ncbi:prolyl oligopeptidase family serine peptidase [Smaragdicoccus niigatensis]|uniref:prolyl oligopeptidase family serine peptidase n=1 Tax=Smaragdicoccus niigatensis TaxID=359359 RepID=UPI00036BE8EA|nr:prolyl oligopeptidase family serine peptidase [Smaragdicoccus niigatensis]
MLPVAPDTYPRQSARTLRFTAGAPRSYAIAPDGSRVLFLRSRGDRRNLLWLFDVESGTERVIADPDVLLGSASEALTPEEKARRERAREGAAGIVGYSTDDAVSVAAFSLSGRLFVTDFTNTRELPVQHPILDPRLSPDGRSVAYATPAGSMRVCDLDGNDESLVEPRGNETWGQAEFIAQEEMNRSRGYWWAPDSSAWLIARVDSTPVARWWIADPANPATQPAEIAYPFAGSANAEVTLWLLDDHGTLRQISWDAAEFPYLARVHWSAGGPPLIAVQSRDQKRLRICAIDVTSGGTLELLEETDDIWIELFDGVPAWTAGGELVRISDAPGHRALLIGDEVVTGPEIHVRAVQAMTADDVLVAASPADAVGEVGSYWVRAKTWVGTAPVTTAAASGDLVVLSSATPDQPGREVTVLRNGKWVGEIGWNAEKPLITARPVFTRVEGIPCAVILPEGHDGSPLPVLMDPYGGPHGQRVVKAHNSHLDSQWFANQGFAVVVADGRGTPGHSPAWEKSVANALDLALDDQVTALQALTKDFPLDLSRVGIRGWSFGGYLAALAVLRRPDVFHAAVSGAPVTDWALYDTHYTERYLGDPGQQPDVYERNSLIADAPNLERPLLLIHGLADDNVVAAHTLRLSSALLAAGRPHSVLPLTGVTHMASGEEVAENLLRLQVEFLKRSLG